MIAVVSITRILSPYFSLVTPLLFVGFLLGAIIAIAFSDRDWVRRTYLGGFVAALIVTNLFLPFTPVPLVQWHKFSDPRAANQTHYEVRLVDANGKELAYDGDALGEYSMNPPREMLVDEDSIEKYSGPRRAPSGKADVARYLLEEGTEYRRHVARTGPWSIQNYKPGMADSWWRVDLSTYDRFVGLRVYKINVNSSQDGTEITAMSETKVYEYVSNRTTTGEPETVEYPA
jgi:hypothetical protein